MTHAPVRRKAAVLDYLFKEIARCLNHCDEEPGIMAEFLVKIARRELHALRLLLARETAPPPTLPLNGRKEKQPCRK